MQRLERVLLILTNVAVVAGLVLVFLELRQNRVAIEHEYNMSFTDIMSDINMAVATDPGLAELLARAENGEGETFSSAERLQLRSWLFGTMEPRISYYWLKHSDVIPPEDWCSVMRFAQVANANDGARSEMERDLTYWNRMVADIDARCGKYVPEPR